MIINPTNFLIHYFTEDLDIIEEKQEVSSTNQIQLQYIPSNTIAMTITYNGAEITNYTVDYNIGVVTFGDLLTNKNVLVSYTAIGEWAISSSKVYTNYDNRDDILETLEDLINKQYAIIEQVKVIGDVATIITRMQSNIDNLRELYEIVLNNETILDNIKTTMEKCVADSNAIILATNTAIANATTSKNNLDASISTANTTKTALENTTTTCVSTINNLVTTKQSEMTSFTNAKQGELTTTSTTCVNNVNEAIGNANDKITELNQWVIDNGDLTDLSEKVNQIKNHIFYDGKIKLVGHRGFSGYAPENTIPSFRLCSSNGYWGAETDVRETSDGKFVLMHDDTVDRMTNGTGTVASKTLAQIKALTIDSGNLVEATSSLKVPTLEEYLQMCKKCSLVPIIEVKAMTSIENFLNILKSYQMIESCMLISFEKSILESIRALNYKIELAYLSNTMTTEEIEYCKSHNFHINVNYSACTESLVREAHRNGILVGVWTIDTITDVHNAMDMCVDFITTNKYIRRENELHRPFVEIGNLKYGRHTYGAGTPYELAHESNLDDKTRIWSDKLNKLEGWETKIYPITRNGYNVAVLFYDVNKLGITDIGWLSDSVAVSIPSNAVYYEIYIGNTTAVESTAWTQLRQIRVVTF